MHTKRNNVLLVPVGIPGSGKSTYAQRHRKEWGNDVTVVSTDRIRAELYGDPGIQGDNQEVFARAYQKAEAALRRGRSVYFDATNLTPAYRLVLLYRLAPYAGRCVALYFRVPLEVCKRRNRRRARVVPEDVLERMAGQLTAPTRDEGFDQIVVLR